MIDLRDSTVLVNNIEEYRAIAKIAMKQGFKWASGHSLDYIICSFPIKLDFNSCFETRYSCSTDYKRSRDYTCAELIDGLYKLILARKGDVND